MCCGGPSAKQLFSCSPVLGKCVIWRDFSKQRNSCDFWPFDGFGCPFDECLKLFCASRMFICFIFLDYYYFAMDNLFLIINCCLLYSPFSQYICRKWSVYRQKLLTLRVFHIKFRIQINGQSDQYAEAPGGVAVNRHWRVLRGIPIHCVMICFPTILGDFFKFGQIDKCKKNYRITQIRGIIIFK